jgi:hypothetical protein
MQRRAQWSGIAGVDISIAGADAGVDDDRPSYDRHNPAVQRYFEQLAAL